MAAGLTEGDGGAHLKTFHPIGPGFSSHQAPSGPLARFQHVPVVARRARPRQRTVCRARLRLDACEAHAGWRAALRGHSRRLLQPRARAGSIASTTTTCARRRTGRCSPAPAATRYGNNNVWQMFQPGSRGPRRRRAPRSVWRPGQQHRREHSLVRGPGSPRARSRCATCAGCSSRCRSRSSSPISGIILNGPTTGGARIRAARASDGSFALVYSPRGESFTLDKSIIKGERQQQYWYDPRYGASYAFKEQDSWGIQTFTPPTSGRGTTGCCCWWPGPRDSPCRAGAPHAEPLLWE